nr:hypothetical protein [Pseudomonas luteola]
MSVSRNGHDTTCAMHIHRAQVETAKFWDDKLAWLCRLYGEMMETKDDRACGILKPTGLQAVEPPTVSLNILLQLLSQPILFAYE